MKLEFEALVGVAHHVLVVRVRVLRQEPLDQVPTVFLVEAEDHDELVEVSAVQPMSHDRPVLSLFSSQKLLVEAEVTYFSREPVETLVLSTSTLVHKEGQGKPNFSRISRAFERYHSVSKAPDGMSQLCVHILRSLEAIQKPLRWTFKADLIKSRLVSSLQYRLEVT